jgi:Uma2 family endonuclease
MAAILDATTEQADAARQAPTRCPTVHRFTVAEYHKMIEGGVFAEDDHVELLQGVVIKMSQKGKRHSAAANRASKMFIKLLGDSAIVSNQNPILLDDNSEPEPGIALLAPQEKEYADRLPQPADILLILEVSDTTLKFDRETKSVMYAQVGIKHYLVMNIGTRERIDMREPSPEGYRSYKTLRADESFNLVPFPDLTINVGELLPSE